MDKYVVELLNTRTEQYYKTIVNAHDEYDAIYKAKEIALFNLNCDKEDLEISLVDVIIKVQ